MRWYSSTLGAIWLTLLLSHFVESAYFVVEEGTDRCFRQDLLESQVLRVVYNLLDKEALVKEPEKVPADCHLVVKDGNDQVVKDHALSPEDFSGAFAFASKAESSHSICVSCTSNQGVWGMVGPSRKLRWSVVFEVLGAENRGILGLKRIADGAGSDYLPEDLKKVASLSLFKGTQGKVELLLDRMNAIFQENEYEKTFEARFSRTSDSVNTDVAAVKVLQIVLISGMVAFQIHHLAKFLQKNKIFDCCLPFRHGPSV